MQTHNGLSFSDVQPRNFEGRQREVNVNGYTARNAFYVFTSWTFALSLSLHHKRPTMGSLPHTHPLSLSLSRSRALALRVND